MEPRLHWTKWYWDAWLSEGALRLSTLEARGAWSDLLALMGRSIEYGVLLLNGAPPSVEQLARILGVPEARAQAVIEELLRNGVASKRASDGALFCRRMVREQKERDRVNRRARRHRRKAATEGKDTPSSNAQATPEPRMSHAPVTPESRTEEEEEEEEENRTPLPPRGRGGREKHRMVDPTGLRIAGWLGRQSSTRWSAREVKAFTALLPLSQSELELVGAYYEAEIPEKTDWRRRDLLTLLNNWPGEVDRARDWQKRRTASGVEQWRM